jgi:hypothetical protein
VGPAGYKGGDPGLEHSSKGRIVGKLQERSQEVGTDRLAVGFSGQDLSLLIGAQGRPASSHLQALSCSDTY